MELALPTVKVLNSCFHFINKGLTERRRRVRTEMSLFESVNLFFIVIFLFNFE